MREIIFGPAGLGPVKSALETLESYSNLGLRACEIAFTYGIYIKPEQCLSIKKKAEELSIELSVHAPYWLNLNSQSEEKKEASKKRIVECCKIGELLGAKVVVFHPGYYGENKTKAFETIKNGIIEIMKEINRNNWKIKIAPETMGKVNVFGSVEEISTLVKETNCSFCIDFAHILARYKKVDYEKIENLFPQKEWHVHFSGIVYGDKGEKFHKPTKNEEWTELLENLPNEKKIRIINESPDLINDSINGLKIYNEMKKKEENRT